MKISKNLGHMEVLDSGASGAVNFVLGFSGKDVAIAYKERVDKGIYAVSVRGSASCKTHLGRLVSSVTGKIRRFWWWSCQGVWSCNSKRSR